MKLVLSVTILCALSTIAGATNHVNIEASGCIPDKLARGFVTISNSGVTTNSTDPSNLYFLYCPVNFIDGQTISIVSQTLFGPSTGGAVISNVYRMTNATGDIAVIGQVVCGPTPTVRTCSASMNYTPNAATETLWIQAEMFVYAPGSTYQETLVNVQLD